MSDDEHDLPSPELLEKAKAVISSKGAVPSSDPWALIHQAHALERIDRERQAFDKGDKVALLAAIRICANHDLAMPDWVANGFIAGYDKVLTAKVKSWDDAFGQPFPDNTQLHRVRQRRRQRLQVWLLARELMEAAPDRISKESIYATIGTRLHISEDQAKKLYLQAVKRFGHSTGQC